jgi:glycosyltransferase involved in cell wall biosynthesis
VRSIVCGSPVETPQDSYRPPVPPRSLAAVLPCRNEAEVVRSYAREVLCALNGLAERVEVVIVDDGSTDATGDLAEGLAREDERVRVVHNRPGRGYGGALRAGFLATTADWVFYTDGDGQFDPTQLRQLLPLLECAEVVAGYRASRVEGAVRRLNGWLWTQVVNRVFGLRVRDVDCAFKVLPGRFVRETAWRSTGALISAEILARAKRAGLRVMQVPVEHRARQGGRASGANPAVIVRAFRELVALSGVIRRGE